MTPLQLKVLKALKESPPKDMASIIEAIGETDEKKFEGVRNAIRTLADQGWLGSARDKRPHKFWLKNEFWNTPFEDLTI